MTRYEKQLKEMTIEKMAEINLKYWDGYDEDFKNYETYIETSDETVFYLREKDKALAHEIEWLKGEVE